MNEDDNEIHKFCVDIQDEIYQALTFNMDSTYWEAKLQLVLTGQKYREAIKQKKIDSSINSTLDWVEKFNKIRTKVKKLSPVIKAAEEIKTKKPIQAMEKWGQNYKFAVPQIIRK